MITAIRAWCLYYVVCALLWVERHMRRETVELTLASASPLFAPGDLVFVDDAHKSVLRVESVAPGLLVCSPLTRARSAAMWLSRMWRTHEPAVMYLILCVAFGCCLAWVLRIIRSSY